MSEYNLQYFEQQERILTQQVEALLTQIATLREQHRYIDEKLYTCKQAISFLKTYEGKQQNDGTKRNE